MLLPHGKAKMMMLFLSLQLINLPCFWGGILYAFCFLHIHQADKTKGKPGKLCLLQYALILISDCM